MRKIMTIITILVVLCFCNICQSADLNWPFVLIPTQDDPKIEQLVLHMGWDCQCIFSKEGVKKGDWYTAENWDWIIQINYPAWDSRIITISGMIWIWMNDRYISEYTTNTNVRGVVVFKTY